MKTIFLRAAALLLALLTLCTALAGCRTGEETASAESDGGERIDITEEGVAVFDKAAALLLTSAYRSKTEISVMIATKNADETTDILSYAERSVGRYRYDYVLDSFYVKTTGAKGRVEPGKLEDGAFRDLYAMTRIGNTCYYDYANGKRYKNLFVNDLSSRTGARTIKGAQRSSIRAFREGNEMRIDLGFSASVCEKTQTTLYSAFVSQLLTEVPECTFRSLSVSSIIDVESGFFKKLTISFEALPKIADNVLIRITYDETFSDVGTDAEIEAPDPELYEDVFGAQAGA